MEKGSFEPHETIIFDKVIRSFDLLINVGANSGYYVCKALKQNVDVLAYEPNQFNVNLLLQNVYANKFNADFLLFPVALSNKSGVMPIYGSSTGTSLIKGWAGQVSETLVPISTFDITGKSISTNKNCLIIIDVEGAELDCLNGAKSLLQTDTNNVFMVEISIDEHQPISGKLNPNILKTFQLFYDFGYFGYTADHNLRKIELLEVKNIIDTNINTFTTHNFLFVKSIKLLNDIGL
jgi:FkbM family methyltransferase